MTPSPRRGSHHKDRHPLPARRGLRRPGPLVPLVATLILTAALFLLVLDTSLGGYSLRGGSDGGGYPFPPDQYAALAPTGHLALAYAHNVSAHRVAVYCLSWAAHSPGTRLVVFTAPALLAHPRVASLYAALGVEGVPFEPPPELDDPADEEEPRKPGRVPLAALQSYLLWLEQNPGDSSRGVAVLASVRDVAVQGDPFTSPPVRAAVTAGRVLISEEGGRQLGAVTIEHHAPSLDTVDACYGAPGVAALGKKRVLNADAVFGRRDGATYYVRLMADILETRVRWKCLRHRRPDGAALAHVVHDIGKDWTALDFRITVGKYKDPEAPVLGAALGLPAVMDGRGVVRRAGAAEEAAAAAAAAAATAGGPPARPLHPYLQPAPAVVTQYGAHPLLLQNLLSRYHPAAVDLRFVQTSGYTGTKLALTEADLEAAADPLPASWEGAARRDHLAAALRGEPRTFDDVVWEMVERREREARAREGLGAEAEAEDEEARGAGAAAESAFDDSAYGEVEGEEGRKRRRAQEGAAAA